MESNAWPFRKVGGSGWDSWNQYHRGDEIVRQSQDITIKITKIEVEDIIIGVMKL